MMIRNDFYNQNHSSFYNHTPNESKMLAQPNKEQETGVVFYKRNYNPNGKNQIRNYDPKFPQINVYINQLSIYNENGQANTRNINKNDKYNDAKNKGATRDKWVENEKSPKINHKNSRPNFQNSPYKSSYNNWPQQKKNEKNNRKRSQEDITPKEQNYESDRQLENEAYNRRDLPRERQNNRWRSQEEMPNASRFYDQTSSKSSSSENDRENNRRAQESNRGNKGNASFVNKSGTNRNLNKPRKLERIPNEEFKKGASPKKPNVENIPKKLNIPRCQKVVCLIIGQTGSGKSTFINTITNFFRNGTLQNKKIAIPTKAFRQTEFDFTHAERGNVQDESQTAKCCTYEFSDPESFSSFTFIDSPGLSDTRGVEQDDENLNIIVNEVIKYPDINAIIIVQNGSEARKVASVKNALVRIRNVLPRAAERNVILVLTNSPLTSNFNLDSLQVSPQRTFLMDNNGFNPPPNPNFVDKSYYKEMQRSWNKSMSKAKEIAEYICSMCAFSAKCFQEMMEEVNKAKQSFHQAKSKLNNLYDLMEQLEEIKMMKDLSINDAKAYQNFKQTKTIDQIEWIDVKYHNTVCCNDDSLCHEKCGLEFTPVKDKSVFAGCNCMGGDSKCQVCHCGPESHYHTKKIPRKIQKRVEEILQDVKDKFDKFTAKANQLGKREQGVAGDMQEVQKSINDTKNEIRMAVQRLKQVAPHYNIADEIDYIIQLAKMQLKQETDTKKRAKLAGTIKRLDEIYQSINY